MAGEMENKFITNVPKLVTDQGDNILFPFSPPIFQTQVDPKFIKDLLEKGSELTREKDDWRKQLAGNMKYGGSYVYKEEYILKVEKYLLTYVDRFFKKIIDNYGDKQISRLLDVQLNRRERKNGTIRLDTMWINYQHKHDFNPPHTHRGSLSFVIFCKVPKNIFNEQPVSNSKDAGKIMFQYGEQSHALASSLFPIEPYEGLFLVFPANMNHLVPSFWTDDERISVAGNFVVV